MILILSEQYEANVNLICEILTSEKVPWVRWNGDGFPIDSSLEICIADGPNLGGSLHTPSGKVDVRDIRAVWNRRWGNYPLSSTLTIGEKEFVTREYEHAKLGFFGLLKNASWMNPYYSDIQARNKLVQLQLATAVGLRIPSTYITQNPETAFEFYCKHSKRIICKAINPRSGIKMEGQSDDRMICTTLLSDSLTVEDFEPVRSGPTLFQNLVDKAYELRVTVVGNEVFSVAIDSQKNDNTKIDWRNEDSLTIPYYAYRLPLEIKYKLLTLMRELNLEYGAIDLIRTLNGEYIFLEVNPGGQYGWLESKTGLRINDAIAEWFIGKGGTA